MYLFARVHQSVLRGSLAPIIAWTLITGGLQHGSGYAWAQSSPSAGKAALRALQDAFVAVAEEVEPAVVTITARRVVRPGNTALRPEEDDFPFLDIRRGRAQRSFRAQGTGSGVIISSDGWVLTNDHVVGSADRVTVKLQDGREFTGTVRRDVRSDLALVKIEGSHFTPARLGDSSTLKIGQWAIAIGSPYRYEGSFSVGVISSLNRRQEIVDRSSLGLRRLYPSMIQTDAAINPGNSGGPLVNLEGEVIGINTAIESETGGSVGIGFAIPINAAKFVIEQLKSKGRVSYGYIGIDPDSVTTRLAGVYKVSSGALVRQEPLKDSPAGKAGIQLEDVITAIDNIPIRNEMDLRMTVSRIAPGTEVTVDLVRGGARKQVRVTLGEAPDLNPPVEAEAPIKPRLGIEVTALTPEVAERRGLAGKVSGVVIKSLEEGSSADESELVPGVIIAQINDTPTPTPDAYRKATADLRSGDVVRVHWVTRSGGEIIRRVALVTID